MSMSYFRDLAEIPDFAEALTRFRTDDLRLREASISEGLWPEGTVHFYRDGVSTRTVETNLEGMEFAVRIFAASSPEDYDLAFRIMAALSGTEDVVRTEFGESLTLSDLHTRFHPPGVWGQIDGSVAGLIHLIDREGRTFVLPGPGGIDYAIGPRVLGKLRAAGEEGGLGKRLVEDMRRVVQGDYEGYDVASVFTADGEANPFRLVMWLHGRPCLLPASKYAVLSVGERPQDGVVSIRREHVADVAEGLATLLDEEQLLLEAADERQWAAIIERARAVEVDLPAG